jgi:osmotically inducible protein OsmC
MPSRRADATWTGTLQDGDGTMRTGSGAYEGAFSFASRFEDEPNSNPEELLAAAHAGCFSMAFANALDESGYDPREVHTEAAVAPEATDDGFGITGIDLLTEAEVPDVDEDTFQEIATEATENCPVSEALAAVDDVTLEATLTR